MNLPYLTIYKGDYLRQNVSGCSLAAQGLWLRLMILMHDSERSGYLSLNGEAMPPRLAAARCSVSLDEYSTLLSELESVRAFARSSENILYSPQIVAEAQERARNADRQRRFKEGKKGNGKVTPEVTEKKRGGNGVSSSSLSSDSNESGAAAPNLWDVGVPLLTGGGVMTERAARGLLGKLIKQHGEESVGRAVAATSLKRPASPRDFLVAACARNGPPPRSQAEMNRPRGGLVE